MKKIAVTPPRLAMSPTEAAGCLGLGEDAFRQRVLPALRVVRCGRRVLIPTSEIEKWLAENTEAPVAEQVGVGP